MKLAPSDLDQARLAQLSCLLEVTARKPGNIHPSRDFGDAHYLDFAVSAAVLGRNLRYEQVHSWGVGPTIFHTVAETARLVGHNTNLGMVLLLAPMAAVAWGNDLRKWLGYVLRTLMTHAAPSIYEAIRIAGPGGLGTVPEQDVSGEPTVPLLEAMALAADRDAIARQYVTDYADVFELALPVLRVSLAAGRPLEAAIVEAQLHLMAERPDTLIARKRGPAVADESALRASEVLATGWPEAPGSADALRTFDAWLREDGHARNPGATADLIAATLYAALWDGTIEVPRHLRKDDWDAGELL